jgi:hypothetical protein
MRARQSAVRGHCEALSDGCIKACLLFSFDIEVGDGLADAEAAVLAHHPPAVRRLDHAAHHRDIHNTSRNLAPP